MPHHFQRGRSPNNREHAQDTDGRQIGHPAPPPPRFRSHGNSETILSERFSSRLRSQRERQIAVEQSLRGLIRRSPRAPRLPPVRCSCCTFVVLVMPVPPDPCLITSP